MDICVVCGAGGVSTANDVVVDEDWAKISEAEGITNTRYSIVKELDEISNVILTT